MAGIQRLSELAEIDAKIEKLRERKRALQKKASERLARLAFDAGLIDIEVSDEELSAGFKELAARFRGASKHQPVARAEPATETAGTASSEAGSGDHVHA